MTCILLRLNLFAILQPCEAFTDLSAILSTEALAEMEAVLATAEAWVATF